MDGGQTSKIKMLNNFAQKKSKNKIYFGNIPNRLLKELQRYKNKISETTI